MQTGQKGAGDDGASDRILLSVACCHGADGRGRDRERESGVIIFSGANGLCSECE